MQNDAQKRLLTIMIYGINSSCKLTLIRFGGMYVQLGDVKLLLPAYTENKDSGKDFELNFQLSAQLNNYW